MEKYHHLVLTYRQLQRVRDVLTKELCSIRFGDPRFKSAFSALREVSEKLDSIDRQNCEETDPEVLDFLAGHP